MKTKELSGCGVTIESTIDCSDHRSPQFRPPDPEEGWRLLRAFMTIGDPAHRSAVIAIVQNFAKSASARVEDGAENAPPVFPLLTSPRLISPQTARAAGPVPAERAGRTAPGQTTAPGGLQTGPVLSKSGGPR